MSTLPVLYIVPGRIQAKRLQILQSSAKRNQYQIRDKYSHDVTHILTEFDSAEQVLRALNLSSAPGNTLIVSCQWLIDSIKGGSPIDDPTTLKQYVRLCEKPLITAKQPEQEDTFNVKEFPSYVCQRKCVVSHKNGRLVDALDVLVRQAEYRDDEVGHVDYSRALAFCKAISALKSLPFEVSRVEEIEKLSDIGPHSLRVIGEVLEDGRCAEVDQVLSSDWFRAMEAFNAVYGVGPATAKKLYTLGMRTIEDLRDNQSLAIKGEDRVAFGLAFYEDLNTAVSAAEAEAMKAIIGRESRLINPDIQLELTGGFRRGKPQGHDIDFLFWHPSDGGEVGFLAKLLSRLSEHRLILHNTYRARTNEEKHDAKSTLDHFEQSLLILKLPVSGSPDVGEPHPTTLSYEALRQLAVEPGRRERWRAVRVDLVVCPVSQHAYALLGWTGNKLFNRSIRDYAKKKMNKRLTSHTMWDYNTQKHIPAASEQEIFEKLQLKYLEPWERNA